MDIEKKVVNESTEENIDTTIDELENHNENDENLPEKVEKIKIHPDEVFKKKVKKVPIKDESEEDVPQMTKVKSVKAKRTMTPEALEKLKLARIKGLETRRKNKELKEAGKVEEIPLSKAKTKKQQIEQETLDKIKPIQNITNNVTNNITQSKQYGQPGFWRNAFS